MTVLLNQKPRGRIGPRKSNTDPTVADVGQASLGSRKYRHAMPGMLREREKKRLKVCEITWTAIEVSVELLWL